MAIHNAESRIDANLSLLAIIAQKFHKAKNGL